MRLPPPLDDLLRRAASPAATQADLDALEARRDEVLGAMAGMNEDPPWLAETTPEALERAYALLMPAEESHDAGEYPFLGDDAQAAVGRWFATRLVPALGGIDVAALFADLPRRDPDIVAMVMAEPSVAAGGAVAAALAPYAITPTALASAGRELSNLAALRLDRAHGGTAPEATVDLGEVRDWACEDPDLPPSVAGRMAEFLVMAAKACPGVVQGFAVEGLGDGLLLREDVAIRGWDLPAPAP